MWKYGEPNLRLKKKVRKTKIYRFAQPYLWVGSESRYIQGSGKQGDPVLTQCVNITHFENTCATKFGLIEVHVE